MQVAYVPEGLEAIVFTADGDMRQALNNLQASHLDQTEPASAARTAHVNGGTPRMHCSPCC